MACRQTKIYPLTTGVLKKTLQTRRHLYQSSNAIRALVVSRELAIPTQLIFPHIKIIRTVSECFSEVECFVHHSWQREIVAVLCILVCLKPQEIFLKTYIMRGMWINTKWTKMHAERVWTCEKAWFLFFLQSSNAICQAQLGKRKIYRELLCVFIWLRALGADALMICNCTLPFIVEDVVKGGMR